MNAGAKVMVRFSVTVNARARVRFRVRPGSQSRGSVMLGWG